MIKVIDIENQKKIKMNQRKPFKINLKRKPFFIIVEIELRSY